MSYVDFQMYDVYRIEIGRLELVDRVGASGGPNAILLAVANAREDGAPLHCRLVAYSEREGTRANS